MFMQWYRDLRFQTLLWLTVDYVTQCFGWAWLWSEILAQIYTEFVKCNFIKTTVFLQVYKKEILSKGLHMFDWKFTLKQLFYYKIN